MIPMKSKILSLFLYTAVQLSAEIVVISSVPDANSGLIPLTSLRGIPLAEETQILVGVFPGLGDGQLLDLAAQSGLSGVADAFVPFGEPKTFGQGVGGQAGAFEIALKGSILGSQLDGEVVSILIQSLDRMEFIVARFPGKLFSAQSDTGLEPYLSLRLSDAKILVGNRTSGNALTSATAPSRASFSTWILGFTSITEPNLRLPEADADFDGRSNFLEYATGGNPTLAGDLPPFWVESDSEGVVWANFRRIVGLGSVNYMIQNSGDLSSVWSATTENIVPDAANLSIMKMRLPLPLEPSGFYRLSVSQ